MLTQEQYNELLPKPKKEITCQDCGITWKFFHKCEKHNQPERSKREDQDKHKNCNYDYIETLCDECYKQFINPGCGALNTMET